MRGLCGLHDLAASQFLGSQSIYILPERMAAQRVQVHSGAMDYAVTYGFWAVGSVAILGATLAFLVW